MNVKGLEPHFFAPHQLDKDRYFHHTSDEYSIDRTCRLHQFTDWVLRTALPELKTTNPDIATEPQAMIFQNMSKIFHGDFHRDPPSIPNRITYITLGLQADGSTASTVLTRNNAYERRRTDKFDYEAADDIYCPPQLYATVFNPRNDLHATPADFRQRTLYKATLVSATTNDRQLELTLPDSELCMSLEASK